MYLCKIFMKGKTLFYIAFFGLLIGGFLFTLAKLIPGFGEVKLPVLSYVRPFSFINQEGKPVTEKAVDGKVYVAEFFFTTCKGVCPKMNKNMKKVYDRYANEKEFIILSHTVDPDTDSVGRMKAYADSLGARADKWLFLTGSKNNLYNAARVSYLLDDPKNNSVQIEDQFLHTQFVALVDRKGRVRKIYDGLKKDEINELTEDIKRLLIEKDRTAGKVAASK